MESMSWATLTLFTFGISELEIPEGKSKGKLNLRFSGSQPNLKLRPQLSAGVWPGRGISSQVSVHSQPWLLCPTQDGTVLGGLELRDAKYAATAQSPCPGFVSAFFFSSLEAGSQYMVHTALTSDLLPQPSMCRDYRCLLQHPPNVLIFKHSSSESV